jgi:EpsI family protein
MSERWTTALVTALLLAVAAVAWAFQLQDGLEAEPESLDALPRNIQGWHAYDLPLEETVESMLRADHNLQRAYVHPTGSIVWFYIGYYGTQRGGAPEHTPWACYPAHGWKIESDRRVTIDRERGLRANELVVEQDGQRRLVLFWYRSYRNTGLLGRAQVLWDHVVGRFRDGRADGALVRISTPLRPGEETSARSRLFSFASALDPLLAQVWPDEHGAG